MKTYVSTVAFRQEGISSVINIVKENNWGLEFSSGLDFDPLSEQIFLEAPVRKLAHNYFPAPADPFVLNLASNDETIRQRSINHCINGLQLTKKAASPFFAAHAGFCIDPTPGDLGGQFAITSFEREEHWRRFITSVSEILRVANQLEVDFLIENNVIAAFNFVNGVNPLLCCESNEIKRLFQEIDHPRFGLLLDTAHLKVSCTTLQLDPDKEVQLIRATVRGVHHSDNDGTVDNNQPFEDNYWFLPYIKQFSHLVHVVEVKNINVSQISNHLNLLERYAN